MQKRHIFFGAIFLIVFSVGTLNLMSNGKLHHEFQIQYLNHTGNSSADPEIDVDNITVKQGATDSLTALINNTDTVSYSDFSMVDMRDEKTPELHTELYPPQSSALQSLPPYWKYSHVEPKVKLRMRFSTSHETEIGNYTYQVQAWNGDYPEAEATKENFTVSVTE